MQMLQELRGCPAVGPTNLTRSSSGGEPSGRAFAGPFEVALAAAATGVRTASREVATDRELELEVWTLRLPKLGAEKVKKPQVFLHYGITNVPVVAASIAS